MSVLPRKHHIAQWDPGSNVLDSSHGPESQMLQKTEEKKVTVRQTAIIQPYYSVVSCSVWFMWICLRIENMQQMLTVEN